MNQGGYSKEYLPVTLYDQKDTYLYSEQEIRLSNDSAFVQNEENDVPDYDFDLVSGRYVIDAKSIMGIFSLDLSKPIDLNIHADDNVEEIMEMLKPYLCD